jgi:gluconate 5-dehydrogenase
VTVLGFSLEGQVALVTGAGRGLGLAIATALGAVGAFVFVNGRTPAPLERAAAAVAAAGGRAQPLPFDVTDEAAVGAAFATLRRTAGRLDVLVNNASLRDRRGLLEFEPAAVRRVVETDLLAPFFLSQAAARLMIEGGRGGRIINVTSIAGPVAGRGDAAYTVAKGGLEALTRVAAADLGPAGITVNAVAPGFFATESNADAVADPGLAAWLARRTALGRWGAPPEIAGAVVFLASPAAAYVTGQVLAVDGGFLAHF